MHQGGYIGGFGPKGILVLKTHTFLLKKEGTLKQPTKGENTRRREENKED